MTRETLLNGLQKSLLQHGFTFQNFSDSNSCFDLIARRQNLVLVIKALSNIDAIRPEHARDLKKISHVFNAHSLIVGERSKVYALNTDVLYERYDLPVLSMQGFEQLLESKLPNQRSFKGQNVVELDVQRLRKEREARELTLKELSQRVGISLESLHRYEHGYPAQLETAEKLEQALHTRLIRGINVFNAPQEDPTPENKTVSNRVLDQLQELGLKLSVFERAPLTAATKESELLVSHSESKQNMAKKALSLEKTQRIIKYPGVIIAKESKHYFIRNIPIVNEDELSTFTDAADILSALNERKKLPKRKNRE